MPELANLMDRRTNVDVVFDYLYEQIASLELMPGSRISEAEIATKFGISRQPVRDAFSRLGNLDLLLIRPQRATEVRKFSLASIEQARFVRVSLELEVLNRAVEHYSPSDLPKLMDCLKDQERAFENGEADKFHKLDYEFHKLICKIAKSEFAFQLISDTKAQVDRLCVLGLMDKARMTNLLSDHKKMVEHLSNKDIVQLHACARLHLGRLDKTIKQVHEAHPTYFDDETE